jgi:hypothetical protein
MPTMKDYRQLYEALVFRIADTELSYEDAYYALKDMQRNLEKEDWDFYWAKKKEEAEVD